MTPLGFLVFLYSPANAKAPQSTESSPNSAGMTSIRAPDQSVICLLNSARNGTNNRSPAFADPAPDHDPRRI